MRWFIRSVPEILPLVCDHTLYFLQAFQNHKLHDPLCEPGLADLTADVDFAYLKSLVSDQGLLNSFNSILYIC